MHLHGHSFWVVGLGTNYSDISRDTFNFEDPILKDTIAISRGGWGALLFTTNNPGFWMFHCHIRKF